MGTGFRKKNHAQIEIIRYARSRDTGFKTLAQALFRQLAADKNEAAFARLAIAPGALMLTVEDHVHALHDEALVVVTERQNALEAQDIGTVIGGDVLDPGEELVRVERLVHAQRK